MKKIISTVLLVLFVSCGGSGVTPSNFCEDPDAISQDFTNAQDTSVVGCNFEINSNFTACSVGPSIFIEDLFSDAKVCSVEADTQDIVSSNFYCSFSEGEYQCYAGITDEGNPSGSMYCIQGELDAPESDCTITYEEL